MVRSVRTVCVTVACLVAVLAPGLARAQGERASIVGVVQDSSGAVLPGVTVEAASPALIEQMRSVITDTSGRFAIVDLRPGTYSVTFSLSGFKSTKREGIVLSGSFAATVNGTLEVGAMEETITVTGASPVVDVQNTLVNNAFMRWGSDALKKKYLPQLATGKVGSYCLSESSSGSDAFALKTKAVKKDGKYILNGQKLWITNAGEADIFIIIANLNPEAGYKGITAFIVERGFKGFSVSKKENKLGIRASSTCELVLEDCEVPLENLLGEEGNHDEAELQHA